MRLINLLALLMLLVCLAACPGESDHDHGPFIISGFIIADATGSQCTLEPGYNTAGLNCHIKYSTEKQIYFVELSGQDVFRSQPPVCVFDGFTHTTKDQTPGQKIETRTTLVSTSQIWVELPSFKNTPPTDAIAQFICTN